MESKLMAAMIQGFYKQTKKREDIAKMRITNLEGFI
jgi:hypothetical protein